MIYHNAPPAVELKGTKHINLYVREGSSSEKRGEVLSEWYRSELQETLTPLIAKWEEILQVKAKHGK